MSSVGERVENVKKAERGLNWIVVWVAAMSFGWLGHAYYVEHAEQAAKAVPALVAQAGCEHWRATQTTKLALATTVVDPSQIPKDHCPHPDIPASTAKK